MDLGLNSSRPWVAVIVEPSSPRPANRRQRLTRLCVQVRGLTVAQFPNRPLAVAVAAQLAARRASGAGRDVAGALAAAALAAWGFDELSAGTNWFRRCLGAIALARVAPALASRRG